MQSTYASQQPTFRSPYSPEVGAILAAFTTQPSESVRDHYITMVDGLVADGVWPRLGYLLIGAAHDNQSSRVNFRNPAQVAATVNSPTHTAFRHWQGDGATSYLNSNYNPSLVGANYSRDDCHMGVWLANDVQSFSQVDFGHAASASLVGKANPTQARGRPQSTSTIGTLTLPVATSVGHLMWTRNNSANAEFFKNGVSIGTHTVASTAVANLHMFLLGGSLAGNVLNSPSTRQVVVAHAGLSLNSAQRTALRSRVNTFLTAVGAASA